MESPIMFDPRPVTPDTHAITAYLPIPGMGVLPVNAFVIRGAEPVIVDTGLPVFADDFVAKVEQVVAPEDVRWIYLTHVDADHVGALFRLLDAAPRAKVVTTFLGMGKLAMRCPVPPERAYLLNPGQALDVGDRTLQALTPPTFDAPETTAIFDTKTRGLFSSDCFGALMPEPADDAAAIGAETLREGLVQWATIDAPWLHIVDPNTHDRALAAVRSLDPHAVLSSHLPVARQMTDTLVSHVVAARTAAPFVGPDQQALMAMAAE